MRRLWSCVIVAVLALSLLSTASVGAAGKKTAIISDPGTSASDCNFQPRFDWTNYSDRATYTVHLWVLFDGERITHPYYGTYIFDWWNSNVTGTGSITSGGEWTLTAATSPHTITYRATLTTNDSKLRVVANKSIVYTGMLCSSQAD